MNIEVRDVITKKTLTSEYYSSGTSPDWGLPRIGETLILPRCCDCRMVRIIDIMYDASNCYSNPFSYNVITIWVKNIQTNNDDNDGNLQVV